MGQKWHNTRQAPGTKNALRADGRKVPKNETAHAVEDGETGHGLRFQCTRL